MMSKMNNGDEDNDDDVNDNDEWSWCDDDNYEYDDIGNEYDGDDDCHDELSLDLRPDC